MKRQETGRRGEELARKYLEERGYLVLETNYRCPEGEIDIVAVDGETLVFVEVRAKTGRAFGTPEESITLAKIRHLNRAAARYCQEHEGLPPERRIDVVAVEMDGRGRVRRLELYENAVGEV